MSTPSAPPGPLSFLRPSPLSVPKVRRREECAARTTRNGTRQLYSKEGAHTADEGMGTAAVVGPEKQARRQHHPSGEREGNRPPLQIMKEGKTSPPARVRKEAPLPKEKGTPSTTRKVKEKLAPHRM